MKNRFNLFLATLCLLAMALPAHAAKPQQAQTERLVLMPLRIPEEDKSLQGAMETALVEGLQQKYVVFSGEQVAQKAREIFLKESRNTAKKECDETRCMQGIAEAFQAELLATANVSKQSGSYFLALSVQNIFDNKVEYSKTLTCENCTTVQMVNKLKELSGAPATSQIPAVADIPDTPAVSGKSLDPESAQWAEVQKGNSIEDYEAYLSQYPKGKYVVLAKGKIKKLKEQETAAQVQQDQRAWDAANTTATEISYQSYLSAYPQGSYANLANARIAKLKKEVATAEAKQKREAAEAAAQAPQPGKVFKDCADCPEMVVIPAGSFNMGSSKGGDERPAHSVSIRQVFALGKTEITRGQFAAFVSATNYDVDNECYVRTDKGEKRSGANWRNPGYQQDDSHPVVCVSWNDAKAYVEWLSRKTGKPYQLPTEAQWEYACRAGGQHEYCGSDKIGSIAWYGGLGGGTTHPSAQKQANAFGLYDMSGNVWEWTADSYHDTYNGAPSDGTEWPGDGARRVLRGGSWYSFPDDARSAIRNDLAPANRYYLNGFRVARTLP